MNRTRFAQPVPIFIGLGFPHDVETPLEAFHVLNEWTGSRGPTHSMALNVCRQALSGETTSEAARLAFEAFARARGMLAPEALAEAAHRISEEWMSS